MTIDKEKLKALAEHAIANNHPGGNGNPFPALAVRVVDVLNLLAEIERLERELHEEEGRSNMASRAHRVVSDKRDRVETERDQLKAENEALRKSIAGKVVCDLELFEDLRDSAAAEADQHRQSMGTYRPQRQEVLDHTVSRCDLLIAATKEASHG